MLLSLCLEFAVSRLLRGPLSFSVSLMIKMFICCFLKQSHSMMVRSLKSTEEVSEELLLKHSQM